MSNIDCQSKYEARFLEKYFKYNLNDYFQEIFMNVYEDIFNRNMEVKEGKWERK
jgi:hypothetical protein